MTGMVGDDRRFESYLDFTASVGRASLHIKLSVDGVVVCDTDPELSRWLDLYALGDATRPTFGLLVEPAR